MFLGDGFKLVNTKAVESGCGVHSFAKEFNESGHYVVKQSLF